MFCFWCRRMKGEREAGHKGCREVGNVDPDTEITFQFGASEQDTEGEKLVQYVTISLACMTLSTADSKSASMLGHHT